MRLLPRHLILLLAFATLALGQSHQDWSRVRALSPSHSLIVKRESAKKLKGTFVSADEQSIALRTASGEILVPRDDVQRVLVRRKGWGASPWVGAAVGFGILAAITVSEGDFNQPQGAMSFGAAGAGLGALGGLLVRAAGQNRLVYERPERQ